MMVAQTAKPKTLKELVAEEKAQKEAEKAGRKPRKPRKRRLRRRRKSVGNGPHRMPKPAIPRLR